MNIKTEKQNNNCDLHKHLGSKLVSSSNTTTTTTNTLHDK